MDRSVHSLAHGILRTWPLDVPAEEERRVEMNSPLTQGTRWMMAKNIGGGAEEMGRKMNAFAHSFNKYCWRNPIGSTLEQSNHPWLRRPSSREDNKKETET